MQVAGAKLGGMLLKGEEPLPGFFNELSQGISPDITQSIVDQSLKDLKPSFQAAGILDSGVAAEISARTSADIRRASEEYNIGNRLNLLNLALSGQAQIQSPILSNSQNLGARLTTLGKTTTNSDSTWKGMNPFVKSFQQSAGSGLGNFANPQSYFKPA